MDLGRYVSTGKIMIFTNVILATSYSEVSKKFIYYALGDYEN